MKIIQYLTQFQDNINYPSSNLNFSELALPKDKKPLFNS